jgi:hypothetical protein
MEKYSMTSLQIWNIIPSFVLLLSKVNNDMDITQKGRPYPENIYLKGRIAISGRTITELATAVGVSRHWLNQIVNGYQKGADTIPKLIKELETPKTTQDHETI